jgi:hypothetical protein
MIKPNQWKRFLKVISDGGSIGKALDASKIGTTAFYDQKKKNPDFAKAYQHAMERAMDRMEDAAYTRAVNGVKERIPTKNGTIIRTVYSDSLLMFLLKAHRPGKFKDTVRNEHTGADGAPLAPAVIVVPEIKPTDPE